MNHKQEQNRRLTYCLFVIVNQSMLKRQGLAQDKQGLVPVQLQNVWAGVCRTNPALSSAMMHGSSRWENRRAVVEDYSPAPRPHGQASLVQFGNDQAQSQAGTRWRQDSERARLRDAASTQAKRRANAGGGGGGGKRGTMGTGARRSSGDSMKGVAAFQDFIMGDMVRLIAAFEPDEFNLIRLQDEFTPDDLYDALLIGTGRLPWSACTVRDGRQRQIEELAREYNRRGCKLRGMTAQDIRNAAEDEYQARTLQDGSSPMLTERSDVDTRANVMFSVD